MISKEILEDIIRDSPCVKNGLCDDKEGHSCFLRELAPYMSIDDRMAEQLLLVRDYRYMTSKKEDYNIGQSRALKEFISEHGAKFAEVYKSGMKRDELFPLVFGILPMPTQEELRVHIKE